MRNMPHLMAAMFKDKFILANLANCQLVTIPVND